MINILWMSSRRGMCWSAVKFWINGSSELCGFSFVLFDHLDKLLEEIG